ncbi:MAG: ribonuclease R [Candidatus Taylorbacteria bacterium]|nr:ribonuclease R [Candidatus Taylorbacteria bacterium]
MENSLIGVISLNAKGKGFVNIEGREDDIQVEPENTGLSLPGDTVQVELYTGFKGQTFGKVVKILERKKTKFVGSLVEDTEAPEDVKKEANGKPVYLLLPDDKRANIAIEILDDEAKPGFKAIAEIVDWTPKMGRTPRGKLVGIIGKKGENNAEMESIVLERGFDTTFSPSVIKEAEEAAKEYSSLNIPDSELSKRRDMRGVFTATIDPFDAKDFDDALSIRRLEDSEKRAYSNETKSYSGEELPTAYYEIGVHIADVAHYVRTGTELDLEARRRAFSVYLVDRTIPMLPSVLSNGMCSLNPHEDRYAFSTIFVTDKDGNILDRWFGRTIIHSDKRFTYEEAQEVLTKVSSGELTVDASDINSWHKAPYAAELSEMNRIAKNMLKERQVKGSIDFETTEIKFKLDEAGRPIAVYKKERLDAHRLVEEYMLLANREVAEFVHKKNKEARTEKFGVYRIHNSPDQDRLQDLGIFVRALGYDFHPTKHISPKDVQKLLKEVEGSPAETVIKIATLRSMAKATYSTANAGHFGLAFDYYTQFTSPIRRYPDLLVHRILALLLEGKTVPHEMAITLEKICLDSSRREVEAADAERASIKYKQVEYMQAKIGQTFDVTVSGIAEWGVYVEEPEAKAEGLIRLKDLKPDDFYTVDQKNYKVIGQNTKTEYNIGDTLTVKLINADLETKMLDYQIVEKK